jgi:hypothetical protein
MIKPADELPVLHPKDLDVEPEAEQWLVRGLWGKSAVGVVGGCPKVCKTWYGLDIATSVASGTPALGHFAVDQPGRALVYLAEDALPLVRKRIECLCRHRRLPLEALDLAVITVPTLRLDQEKDLMRLTNTLARLKPKLLLLDPLVRLHRLDENSAMEISGLLGSLRELQRAFDVAIMLVHHASKRTRSDPGQTLRGSGDLHAFGDSNAYLARKDEVIVLTLEHRAAKAIDPIALRLVSGPDEADTHLELADPSALAATKPPPLKMVILDALRASTGPLTGLALRDRLRVNNQRLGEALQELERSGMIVRAANGWRLPESRIRA